MIPTAAQIRRQYIDFFVTKHGHREVRSASVVPENDPTVLFTTAGMHPLVPYLLGEPHPSGKRLTNHQKCIRTGDIDEVGDASHLTFFEMLGNWSLGDYFKKEAIEMSFEFLTEVLKIDKKMLSVSCFGGDDRFPEVPRDDEAANIWLGVGMPKERIGFIKGGMLESEHNWWGPAGQTGPCGPDTEMFYWIGEGEPHGNPAENDKEWLEIWNDVFMQYFKTADGKFEPLAQKNVDTGMGLERVTCVLQGKKSVYETELFEAIIAKIIALAKTPVTNATPSVRIIADHLRAATMMAADGVRPSNVDQGYVMRRLIRRAIRHGKMIGIDEDFTVSIVHSATHSLRDVYPELNHEETITEVFRIEEEQFRKTLIQGLKEFEKHIEKLESTVMAGLDAFHLYDTYGFPIEMTQELAEEAGLTVDKTGFDEAFKKHQDLSRVGAAQKFAGGLADHSEQCKMHHTATHLVHQALRDVLGTHVFQRGSNITKERLRFDFSQPVKMTPEQVKQAEEIVNREIQKDLPIHFEILDVDEAHARGAIGIFDDKYASLGNKVKVYFMGDYSKEVCGGPHVEHTGVLKSFKILKEEACSAGVRRIKAVVEGIKDVV